MTYAVGSLVTARGREWVVLPQDDPELLLLRPLGGTEREVTGIFLPLEPDVRPASFPPPDPAQAGDHTAGALLRDAVRLGLRTGAGPFRAFGRIAVEPRPYQLVPLLMALRQDPVRLLIADDVGVGKTVEAALIARELLDRGEIDRICVLCPPHLCEQWQAELDAKFHIQAEVVRPGTITRLERDLPAHESVFERYPYVVVSVDYIKSDRRRADFVRACAEFVIVDEAHTCAAASGHGGQQQRHALLEELAKDPARHLVLATATPHSGIPEAFRSLLRLLDPRLAELPDEQGAIEDAKDRELLARFLVQRRRGDIVAYLGERSTFPRRVVKEPTYTMSPAYRTLFGQVLQYVDELVRDTGEISAYRRRVRWYAALALLRCVSSSPAAAAAALRTRAGETEEAHSLDAVDRLGREAVLDLETDESASDDTVPGADTIEPADSRTAERRRLRDLAAMADALQTSGDTKLAGIVPIVRDLLAEGFSPVIYCRYIATAAYVAEHLARTLRDTTVEAVTGELPQEERMARVRRLGGHPRRVLVATDCLSEGINLQEHFDAVVHYDLAWNPTRHEQREGRVDRFGQPKAEVRAVLYYGADNGVDGIILKVLLRKAESIRRSLGVSVPMPLDSTKVLEAIFEAVLLRGRANPLQLAFDFSQAENRLGEVDLAWDQAAAREVQSNTKYRQAGIRPEEVARELREAADALGDHRDVRRFVEAAAARLGASLTPDGPRWLLDLGSTPGLLAIADEAGLPARTAIAFELPTPPNTVAIARTHPVIEALAARIAGTTLDPDADGVAARCGAIRTRAVSIRTTLLVVRLRYQITVTERGTATPLLAEECQLAAVEGSGDEARWLDPEAIEPLLAATPAANVPAGQRTLWLQQAISALPTLQPGIAALAERRAAVLLAAHERVRAAARLRAVRHTVEPLLPADILGVYVLMPSAQ